MAIPCSVNEGFVGAVRQAGTVLGKEFKFAVAFIPDGDKWTIKLVEMCWNSHPTSIIDEVGDVRGVVLDQRLNAVVRLAGQRQLEADDIICCEMSRSQRLWICLDSSGLKPILDTNDQPISSWF